MNRLPKYLIKQLVVSMMPPLASMPLIFSSGCAQSADTENPNHSIQDGGKSNHMSGDGGRSGHAADGGRATDGGHKIDESGRDAATHNNGNMPLLQYDFGNQTYGSSIEIEEDGTIVHTERTCCPATTTPKTETPLSSSALAMLRAEIEAAKYETVESNDYRSDDNAKYGTLAAYAMDGQKVLIREYLMGTENTAQGSDADSIVSLVNQYATHHMR